MRKLKDIIKYARGENPKKAIALALISTIYGNFQQVGIVCKNKKECAAFVKGVESLHTVRLRNPEFALSNEKESVFIMTSFGVTVTTKEQAKRSNEHIHFVNYDKLFDF